MTARNSGNSNRSGTNSLKTLLLTTSTLALLAIAVSPQSAHGQTYTGNDTTNGPFNYSGLAQFRDSSKLNAAVANTVTDGTQMFYDTSMLDASVANAVSGGLQYFKDSSVLTARAANSIHGGQQDFSGDSTLNVNVTGAIGGGAQYFRERSTLNLNVADGIGGGTQTFFEYAALNIGAAYALDNTNALIFSNQVGGGIGGFMYLNGIDTVVGRITSAANNSGWISNNSSTAATLTIDSSILGDSSFSGVITDGGAPLALVKRGSGALTLSGSDGYSGGTTIEAGTLLLRGGGSLGAQTGSLTIYSGAVLDLGGASGRVGGLSGAGTITTTQPSSNGHLFTVLDQLADTTFSGVIKDGIDSSSGGAAIRIGLRKTGAGTLTLSGVNTFTGGASVDGGGRLNVGDANGGSIAGDVSVNDLGTLGGQGAIGGQVTVNSGGTLLGVQGQTLTMTNLVLTADSNVAVTLGAPATTGLFKVTGALTLDGTLNVTGAGGFGNGLYRLFDAGSITNNGLAVGATPNGYAAGDLSVQTTTNQVNLLVGSVAPGSYAFWDGPNTAADNIVNGGAGTWSASGINWTNASGGANGVYDPASMLIFQGAPGAVTVSAGGGALTVDGGMQFFVDGYKVTGDALNLTAAATPIRVGDGSATGASMTAVISSALTGTGGIDKTDLGTLTLTGASNFSGEIAVDGGVLAIRDGGSVSNASGVIAKDAGATGTVVVDGSGSIWTSGSGVLVGVGVNSNGTLNVTNGGGILQTGGDGVVGYGGTGAATVDGVGSTWINRGATSAIQVGINGGSGALSITNGGSVSGTFGQIGYSGDGTVTVDGAGSTWISTSNLNVGAFGDGTLNITNGGGVSSATGVVGNGSGAVGTVTIDSAGSWTNTGALVVGQGGSGTLNLNGVAGARGVLKTQNITKGQGAGAVNFDGGILRAATFNADLLGNFAAGEVTIKAGGAFIDSNGGSGSISSPLGGIGALTKLGAGSLTLTGANTYAGGTVIESGTLQVFSTGTLGATTGALSVANGATLDLGGTSQTVGALSGAGDITSTFLGNLSLLTVNQATNTTFSGVIGDGFDPIAGGTAQVGLSVLGGGVLTLSGVNSYTGPTTISGGGEIQIDGSITSAVTVNSGGALSGAGTIFDAVTLNGRGVLAGESGQTLTMNSLTLNDGSVVVAVLGAPSTTELFKVRGDLVLTGASLLEVSPVTGFGAGLYRVIGFDGNLTGGGSLAVDPAANSGWNLEVQTAAHQVNLLVGTSANPGAFAFWNGAQTTPNNAVNGGAGTWTANGTNWTNTAGSASGVYDPAAMLIFQGAPGTVTVSAGGGALDVKGGMQFFVDGYKVAGDALNLTAAATPVRVGDGAATGAGMTATIASVITGSGGLDKTDLGTLVLSGLNTYTGGTTISAGTLKFDVDLGGTLGAPTGALAIAGGAAFDLTGTNQTVSALSGAGSITSSVYGGRQSLLTVNQAANTSFSGAITDGYMTGAGDGGVWLIKGGAGALTLSGDSAFAFLTVDGGTVAIANGGTVANETSYLGQAAGSNGTILVTGDGSVWSTNYLYLGYQGEGTLTIADGAKVSIDTLDMGYTSSSSGTLNLNGAAGARGVLETGFVGGNRGEVTVNFDGGILRATDADTLLSTGALGSVTIKAGGAFIDSNSYQMEIASALGGVGALTKLGAGTLTLTGANSYAGGTIIDTGTLRLAGAGTLGAPSGTLTIAAGAALDLGSTSQTVGSLSGAGDVTSTVTTGTPSILTVDQAADTFFSGAIRNGIQVLSPGSGSLPPIFATTTVGLTKSGAGSLTLTGNNAYTGDTNVTGGTLLIDGALGNTQVTVASGAALGGGGTIAGDVSVADGGILLGRAGQSLSMGSLALSGGAFVNVSLGAPSTTGLFDVTGDLTLNGTLNVNNAGGFGDGLYRLFDYGGTLSGSGLVIGATPAGYAAGDLAVQTAVAHQVNLVASSGPYIFWDGANTIANGAVDGGSGVWSAAGTNWTNTNATGNGAFDPATMLIFVGAPGTVTLDAAGAGALDIGASLQFASDGFLVQGDGLSLTGGVTIIRVGDGSAAGASMTATIDSALGGAGGVNKTDLGTLVLSGLNTYTGDTTISGGALAIAATGGITSDVTNNAAFRNAGTVAGRVTNNAGAIFTQTGGSVSNGLVNAGTVNANGGALNGAIANNAGGSFAVHGTVTSNGAFDNASGATLAVTATGSYAIAGLLTNSGGVTVAQGGSMSAPAGIRNNAGGVITNNGVITDALDNAGTVTNNGVYNANVASNTGVINNNTGATWNGNFSTAGIVNNAGTINGGLTQTGGTTTNTGAIIGMVTIADGLFTGTGSVGGLNVGGGARVAPGSGGGIGTMNVAGGVTFNSGSIYQVAVNAAGQASHINATGQATLNGGTVNVLAGAGNYRPQTDYTILSATGGVSGAFAGVTSNLAFLDPSLSYDAGAVYLRLRRNDISFAGIGLTANQIAVGGPTEALGWNSPVFDAVVNLSADQARDAFDQLSGDIQPSMRTTMLEDSRFVRGAVLERFRASAGGEERGVWGQAIGNWGRTDSDGNAARLDRSTGGLLMGFDARSENIRLGAVWGYDRTNIDTMASSGRIESYHLGAYAGGQWGAAAIRTGIAYSWSDLRTTRNMTFPGFSDTTRASYDGGVFQAFGELGYGFDLGRTRLEPYANVAYVRARTGQFSETGGDARLAGASAETDVTFTTLGLRAATGFDLGGAQATLRVGVGWRHAFGDATPATAMRYQAGGAAFPIAGLPVARDAATIDAGLDVAISGRTSIGISYGGQFGNRLSDQSARASLVFRF